MKKNDFSVLMSVYSGEKPDYLRKSVESLIQQTLLPSRIIIVKDGRLTDELEGVLSSFARSHEQLFLIVGYEKNLGLGEALNFGLRFVETEYFFRMDADDIAVPERCFKQWDFLQKHHDVDVLGTNILEFKDDPSVGLRVKQVPGTHEEIMQKSKLKNPMNHMTVAVRTDAAKDAGGYRHAPFFEDYDLWARMLYMGKRFHNLQENLVLARVGNDMIGKRHGWKYCGFELQHFLKMKRMGFLSLFDFTKAVVLRVPLRLVPKKVLATFYNFALRKDYEG